MCIAVRRYSGESYWNLNALLAAGVIQREHVALDDDDPQMFENCFCSVNVEDVLERAQVPFDVDDLGDLMIASLP